MANLLTRVAEGDEQAVSECIDRYGGLVYGLARRFLSTADDAADAAQEIFIALWQSAGKFDPSIAAEKTFVAMIARRRLIDRLRRLKRQPPTAPLDEAAEPEAATIGDAVERSEEAARVLGALESLKPEQQKVIRLAVLSGWTHKRISDHLSMPLGTVKTHVRRGLMKVRERLSGESA